MSTREWAIVIWVVIATFIMLIKKNYREITLDILKSLFALFKQPVFQIIILYQMLVIISLLLVLRHFELSLWGIKDYWVFFFATLFTLFGEYRVKTFWSVMWRGISFGALLSFMISNYTFPLWLELLGMPVVVLIIMLAVISEKQEQSTAARFFNGIIMMIAWATIIWAIIQFSKNWQEAETLSYWESFIVEFMAWPLNVPLIILAIPLYQFDTLDNFRVAPKSLGRLMFHTLAFLIKVIRYSYILLFDDLKQVSKVSQGGLMKRSFQIFLYPNTSQTKARRIMRRFELMMVPRSYYRDQEKRIPIHIECKNDGANTYVIPSYDISDISDEFKFETWGL